ncbi:hypothetical protein RhiirC2_796507 [Rhizophagus irregularis]|uniref:Uncharacterized protein n=1 Tax=Rhizophagus irregularis TaxID=588596 RepID=A0A2N1M9M1_9GLOM|nr:hypothetical protein RhiirC2_796507 [Rhizophagus irregularis]
MDHEIIKKYNVEFGGNFVKVIKINKIKYILIYFNNENDLMKAIYDSTMIEDKIGINSFKVPTQTKSKDKFVDAKSDILSTIPTTEEEHIELDELNNNFSERLEKIGKTSSLPRKKDKKVEEEDKVNKNKKRVVTTQGQREDSDSE